ncbi:hypothetical protein [Haloferax sp. KTX1]|uniref:hypothetical protein n=1 Tax=Haloferax sp. KTX1 TaxID=2600597 RepID=UPI0011DDE9A0|nr:hypothetical protein [Haloferax sp. KTX1]
MSNQDADPVAALPDEAPTDSIEDSEPTMMPPNVRQSRFGFLGTAIKQRRYEKKRKKLANKGYIEWLLIDSQFPRPRFIKPKAKGGGILEYEHDGETYLFPRNAMVPSAQTGMWTVVHKKGQADPINLREPVRHSIGADTLTQYLEKRVTTSPPGLLSRLDINPKDLVMYGMMAIVAFALIQGMI